jgi:catechol 2,3-dioxygenase-like lactoylglutathione lyase family enzyme
MESHIGHIQINVSDKNKSFPFYKELLTQLGYRSVHEEEHVLGMGNGKESIWFDQVADKYQQAKFHRKQTGINHLAFWVSKKEDVDEIVNNFVKARGLATLYGSPKEFPEYMPGYYAVFFEDPDRIKIEIVYHPV